MCDPRSGKLVTLNKDDEDHDNMMMVSMSQNEIVIIITFIESK